MYSTVTAAQATFTYEEGGELTTQDYTTRISPAASGQPTTAIDTLYSIQQKSKSKYLTSVALGSHRIEFKREYPFALVNELTIRDQVSQTARQYTLKYMDVMGSGLYAHTVRKKFLWRVMEANLTDCVAFPAYEFSYVDVSFTPVANNISNAQEGSAGIPWASGQGEDYFGFYNGQFENKNIPTVYYYANETGARRLRVTPIIGLTPTQTLHGASTTQNLMAVSAIPSAFGALQKITYPTGGYTLFVWEGNRYWDSTTGEELVGPGVRVSSILTHGGGPSYGRALNAASGNQSRSVVYEYVQEGSSTTSGRILYPPVFAYSDGTTIFRSQRDLGPGTEVMYSRIKESITGQGYRVYRYDLPNTYPDVAPVAPTNKLARLTLGTYSTLKNGAYTFPYAPLQDLGFKRGFLTRVTEYTQAGVPTQERRMVYTQPQTAASIKALRFEAIPDASNNVFFHYSVYEIPYGQSRIISQEVVKSFSDLSANDSTKVTTAYTYNTARNLVTRVTQTNDDNSVVDRYIRYAADFNVTNPITTDEQAKAIQHLNSNQRSAEVIETYSTFTPPGGTLVYTDASLSLFKLYGSSPGYVWPHQARSLLKQPGSSFTPASVSVAPNQTFAFDSKYLLTTTVDYENGLPVNSIGIDAVQQSSHYSTDWGVPVATFVNCRAEHAVFDGFETSCTRGLTRTPNNTQPGWTGGKALQFDKFTTISTSQAISRSGNKYRISFWVFSTATGTVRVKAVGAGTDLIAYAYTTANHWKHVEYTRDVSALGATFNLSVYTTDNSVVFFLDDFLALPENARVTLSTVKPMAGVTSQTDDHGNSISTNYDALNRPTTTLDNSRNLVAVQEYAMHKQGVVELVAAYKATTAGNVFRAELPITFTALQPCVQQVQYDWTFYEPGGIQTTATGASVVKTFPQLGYYRVLLTVSKAGYATVSSTQGFCISAPGDFSLSISVSPNAVFHECSVQGEGNKTFTATFSRTSPSGWVFEYTWYMTDQAGNWTSVIPGGLNGGAMISCVSPEYDYYMKCEVVARKIGNPEGAQCNETLTVGSSNTIFIDFIPEQNCP